MDNYGYIFDLSKTVLTYSKSIKGRIYMGHRYGLQEINYDLLGQDLDQVNVKKEYPFTMLSPPHSLIHIGGGKEDGWKEYRINMFFCDTTYYKNQNNKAFVSQPNNRTRTSTEPLIDIWSKMDTCAIDFLRVISEIQRNIPTKFRLLSTRNNFIVPFSEVSMDRVSGVRLSYDFQLFIGCDIEDYNDINYNTLII